MVYPREYERGPTPWVPATILGIILLIVTTPYSRAPDPAVAYQPIRQTPGFPLPLLWIPVLAFIAYQVFGGHRRYSYDHYGRPVTRAFPQESPYNRPDDRYIAGVRERYGAGYAGGPGQFRSGNDYNSGGWGGWPWSRSRYSNNGLGSLFMDYGGHWIIMLVGIALFAMVASSTAPSAAAAALPAPRLGFPWSLFFPSGPQFLLPLM